MIGINIENLNKLIKINSINSESLNKNLVKLADCLNDLNNCYDGMSIRQLFGETSRQDDNFKRIITVIDNYSEVLSSIKTSYEKQDASFQGLFNQANAKN